MILSSLTDTELLRHARAQFDPLTSTEIEAELIKRMEDMTLFSETARKTLAGLDDIGLDLNTTRDLELITRLVNLHNEFESWDIRGLLEALGAQGLDNVEALGAVLERDASLQGLLDDLADPIAKLNRLANPETTATEGAN